MSAATALPVEQEFATGQRGETLVLMVCAAWIWAGRYTSAPCASLLEVAASASRAVRISPTGISLGGTTFSLNRKATQAAHRWLDRQGVSVRVVPANRHAPRHTSGAIA